MKKFKMHSDLESPFWMVRLILHGITTLIALVMVISAVSVIVTNFFTKDTTFKIAPAVVLAIPGVVAFCYHLPQWVCVVVGEGHRGIPPYPVVIADSLLFVIFIGITIYYGASGQFGRAFSDHGFEVFFARGCVISAPTGAGIHFFLSVIGAYDIFFIRQSHKEQVYVVTGYQAPQDLAGGLEPASYGGLVLPVAHTYDRAYHSGDRSVDSEETEVLKHDHQHHGHLRYTSIV